MAGALKPLPSSGEEGAGEGYGAGQQAGGRGSNLGLVPHPGWVTLGKSLPFFLSEPPFPHLLQ